MRSRPGRIRADMGGANSWRAQITGADWMRDMEKRVLHEERRPTVQSSSDLLGPGISSYSVEITDWNANETAFNGFFHSEPGALNSPDGTLYWMGTSQSTREGNGYQRVTQYPSPTVIPNWPRPTYLRQFSDPYESGQRTFGPWAVQDGTPVGILTEMPAGVPLPNNYHAADGTTLSIAGYPDLYAVIGTRFNTGGEPGGTFRLPNVAGRIIKV